MAAVISFDYPQEKIDKLDELSANEGRTRSAYIQKVLADWIESQNPKIVISTDNIKKKLKLKRKGA